MLWFIVFVAQVLYLLVDTEVIFCFFCNRNILVYIFTAEHTVV